MADNSFIDNSGFVISERHLIRQTTFEGKTSQGLVVEENGKQFFLKRLREEYLDNNDYRTLFRKEFELGNDIHHENIVKYYSLTDEPDECSIKMEYVAGQTLAQRLGSDPDYFLSRRNIDKFFIQLLNALGSLHRRHVVYSDLKPENIILTQVGNDVKLIDLGFCFTDAYSATAGKTDRYAAPEHADIDAIDITTDIYCVGQIINTIKSHTSSAVPKVYYKIARRCINSDKSRRYQSTDEIIRTITARKRTIRRSLAIVVTSVLLFLGVRILFNIESFVFWWDALEIIPKMNIDYDIEDRSIYYKILSETDRTCTVVGASSTPNGSINIMSQVKNAGITYDVVAISDEAFQYYENIKAIYIPEGIKTIGENSFKGCMKIATISLPNTIKKMGVGAFNACKGVKNIKLSSSLTEISRQCFVGCSIESLYIPEGVERIGFDAFAKSDRLIEVYLPSSLKVIDRGVFYECKLLREITIPAAVTEIGEYAFYEDAALTDIYNLSPTPQIVTAIVDHPERITLHVPAEAVEAYSHTHHWRDMHIVPIE